jgi:hypothetical protein
MTALILTPAAIRAIVLAARDDVRSDSPNFAAARLDTLAIALDPAHQAVPTVWPDDFGGTKPGTSAGRESLHAIMRWPRFPGDTLFGHAWPEDIGSAMHAPPAPKPIDPSPRFMRPDTGETHGELDELLHDADWYTPTAIIDLWKGSRRYVVRTAIGDAAGDVDGHDWDIFDSQAQAEAFCASAKAPPAPPTIELPASPGLGADAPMGNRTAAGAPQAPEAPPPAQAAEGRRHHRLRATPEDDALLRELWPQAMPFREMMRQFNERASSPVKSDVRLRERAIRLGLNTHRQQAMVAAGNAPAGRGMVKGVWTPERDALLTERYPREGIRIEVLDALNALPGPPIESPNAVKARAHRLNLRLDEDGLKRIGAELAAKARAGLAAKRAERRAAIAAVKAEREPEAEPEPPEPPAPPLAAPEPAPPLPPPPAEPAEPTPEESAAIADAAVATKYDRVRASLRTALKEHRNSPPHMALAQIGSRHGLPLREVMRLLGEVRNERTAA